MTVKFKDYPSYLLVVIVQTAIGIDQGPLARLLAHHAGRGPEGVDEAPVPRHIHGVPLRPHRLPVRLLANLVSGALVHAAYDLAVYARHSEKERNDRGDKNVLPDTFQNGKINS